MSQDIDLTQANSTNAPIWGMNPDTYCLLLHLSQLLGMSALPILGWAVPVVLWVLNKDKNEQIDQHGKHAMNWMISLIIYTTAAMALSAAFAFFLFIIMFCTRLFLFPIGLLVWSPIFLLLWAAAFIFPIIAAVKAHKGIAWKYPLSITFFK